MLKKIEDIHTLEVELVKIEGQNQNTQNLTPNKEHNSHRNEEVMSEIRNMLKEMVNSEASINPNTQNIAVNKIYEEYSKLINNNTIKTELKQEQTKRIIENVESSDIYKKFDTYKGKVEQEYVYLVDHSRELDANLPNMENIDQAMNEIEKFKNLIRMAENNFNKEKSYLFKELDNFLAKNPNNSNRVAINNLKANIDKVIFDKHIELQSVTNGLYSSLSSSHNTSRKKVHIKKINYNVNATQQHHNSDSSFLTEEEEAIRKISERIRVLKARIDTKDKKKSKKSKDKQQKRQQNSGVVTSSNENLSSSSYASEDTDNRELQHLNEQIRLLKSRMIAKGF
jgi:hypothetical protein